MSEIPRECQEYPERVRKHPPPPTYLNLISQSDIMKPENIPQDIQKTLQNLEDIIMKFKETPTLRELVITFKNYLEYPQKIEAAVFVRGAEVSYQTGIKLTKWEKTTQFGLRLFKDADAETFYRAKGVYDIFPRGSEKGKEREWFILAVKILAKYPTPKVTSSFQPLTILQRLGNALENYFDIPKIKQKIEQLKNELKSNQTHLETAQSWLEEFDLK